jgi:hypothetical protein
MAGPTPPVYTNRLMVLSDLGIPTRMAADSVIELTAASLDVGGNIDLTGALDVGGALAVTGQITTSGNLIVDGDLVVKGDRIVNNIETVLVKDNFTYVNAGYTSTDAKVGGLAVNYLPTGTYALCSGAGVFTAGDGINDPQVTTDTGGSNATFSAGDLIQISGTLNGVNDGLYEVKDHTAGVLKIRSADIVESFTDYQFTTDTDLNARIDHVNVSIIRAGDDGIWQTGHGNQTPIAFDDIASLSTQTLQAAYEAGQSINVDSGDLEINLPSSTFFKINGASVGDGTLSIGGDDRLSAMNAYANDLLFVAGDAGTDKTTPPTPMTNGAFNILAHNDGTGLTESKIEVRGGGNLVILSEGGNLDLDGADGVTIDSSGGSVAITADTSLDLTGVDLNVEASGDVTFGVLGQVSSFDVNSSGAVSFEGSSFDVATAGAVTIGSDLAKAASMAAYVSGSMDLVSAEADALAIHLHASDAAGGIKLEAGADIQMVGADLVVDASGDVVFGQAAQVSSFDVNSSGAVSFEGSSFDVATAGAVTIGSDLAKAASMAAYVSGSMDLVSAEVADDAVYVHATAGGIKLEADGVFNLDSAAATLTVDSLDVVTAGAVTIGSDLAKAASMAAYVSGSMDLVSAEAAVDAIYVHASDAAGGIKLESGTGGILLNTDGDVKLEGPSGSILLDSADSGIDVAADGAFGVVAASAEFTVADDAVSAFVIQEGANKYFDLSTEDGSEAMVFGNSSTNPSFDFAGTGVVSMDALYVSKHAKFEEVAAPSNVADHGFVYVKADSLDSELFFYGDHDGSGLEVQITKDGFLNVQAIASSEFLADGAIAAGDAVCISTPGAGGELRVVKANATTSSGHNYVVGLAKAAAADGEMVPVFALPGVVVESDTITNYTTPGAMVYLSKDTAGKLTVTAPSEYGETTYKVGYALSSNKILFQPQLIALN